MRGAASVGVWAADAGPHRRGAVAGRLARRQAPRHRRRGLRATEVPERLDTDEAREALRILAKGEEGARLTREAEGALGRLK